ncbi:hypothetical protein P4C99_16485 [Pontiellaceae bacterium B1224]|nr:hypothetical protein [Pontiellaceae bacterium B1224]
MNTNRDITKPNAWEQLLALPPSNRVHRTTWVYYMLGNIAAQEGDLSAASEYWNDCREAVDDGFKDSLGLARATFKTEYLAQTNISERILYGVRAIAYYDSIYAPKKLHHCTEHLRKDVEALDFANADQLQLETAALFLFGNNAFISRLKTAPPLKVSPRLAWFAYKSGEAEMAAIYLDQCPENDALSIWLRFRVAQREGKTKRAITHLQQWLRKIQNDNRVFYEFEYNKDVSQRSATYGNLGNLFASENQMLDALMCFIQAGSFHDAALIAERYLPTETLIQCVDTFESRPIDYQPADYYYESYKQESSREFIERHISYLLARRLFREDRAEDALPYYPPAIAKKAKSYLDALQASNDFWETPNTRSAHLFHAARILRWKGMELSGTELGPDYRITEGLFDWSGVRELLPSPADAFPIHKETAPSPDIRFHYRHRAADLAGRAAELSWNRHQKAAILWCAGNWIKIKHPNDADAYYKTLAKIPFQPLAKATHNKHWFPESTHLLSYIYRGEDYIEPKMIAKAAKEYGTD